MPTLRPKRSSAYITPAAGDSVLDSIATGTGTGEHDSLERDLLGDGEYSEWLRTKGYLHKNSTERLKAFKATMSTSQRLSIPIIAGIASGTINMIKSGYGLTQNLRGQPINPNFTEALDRDTASILAKGKTAELLPGATKVTNTAMRTSPVLAGPIGVAASSALAFGETSSDSQTKLQRQGYSPQTAAVESRAPALAAAATDIIASKIPGIKYIPRQVNSVVKPLAETLATDTVQNVLASAPASPWAAAPFSPAGMRSSPPTLTAARNQPPRLVAGKAPR